MDIGEDEEDKDVALGVVAAAATAAVRAYGDVKWCRRVYVGWRWRAADRPDGRVQRMTGGGGAER